MPSMFSALQGKLIFCLTEQQRTILYFTTFSCQFFNFLQGMFETPEEKCLPDSSIPANATYHVDELVCGQAIPKPFVLVSILPILLSVFVHR